MSEPDCTPAARHAEMVHAALQTLGVPGEERQCVLVSAVTVCDWMDQDGNRWLTRSASPGLPLWQVDGLLAAALDNYWEDD